MSSIKPHGGVLINRVATEAEREALLAEAAALQSIIVNTWTISDLDLIGVGAFSPLTGFMNEADYRSVVETYASCKWNCMEYSRLHSQLKKLKRLNLPLVNKLHLSAKMA